MESTLRINTYCCLTLFGIHVILTYGCGQSEYQSGAGQCCPMCNIGSVVHVDCHGDYSTTCIPCVTGRTFMDQPNGLKLCFLCKSCDRERGLRVVQPCAVMRDTQCGVLDGYYCKEFRGTECSSALKHTQCHPGETTRTPGNEVSDTVCEACPSGFYSPLGINCTRWTDCSVRNEVQQREGSAVEDVQCRPKTPRHRYCLIPASALLLILLIIFLSVKHKRPERSDENSRQVNKRYTRDSGLTDPVQETGHGSVHSEPSDLHRLTFLKRENKESRSAQPRGGPPRSQLQPD